MKKIKLVSSFVCLIMLTGCSGSLINNTYTVMWFSKNSDGVLSLLETDHNVKRGETPTYDGETPTKDDVDYTRYVFTGWDPEPGPIYQDTDYYAVFRAEEIKFNVNWRNYDGSIIKTTEVRKGYEPVYDGDTPTRPTDVANTYTFAGWAAIENGPVLSYLQKVYYDTDYYAIYDGVLNNYTVKWVNYDDTPLYDDEIYCYGQEPVYKGQEPVRPGNDKIANFPFIGWDQELHAVDGNITYKAVFDLFEDLDTMYEYEEVDDGYRIKGYSNSKLKESAIQISIPREHEGKEVVEIANGAFEQSKLLETVVLPDSIKSIGERAFMSCPKLVSVILNNGLTSLGSNAFTGCSSLEEIVIPSTVTSIGKAIFANTTINKLTIPFIGKSLDEPDTFDYLFDKNYKKLTELRLLEGCKKLAFESFMLDNLDVYLPSSLEDIGGDLKANNVFYAGELSDWLKVDCAHANKFTNFYFGDDLLTTLNISSGVSEIKKHIFSGINSLTSVNVGGSVTKIGNGAFNGCKNLTDVYLGDSITEIESSAFANSGIINVRLPANLSKVGVIAFCSNSLKSVYFDGNISNYLDIDFAGPLFSADVSQGKLYLLDDNGDVAYKNKNYSLLTNLVLPSETLKVKQYQFYHFTQITNVTFNYGLLEIETSAFEQCNIKNIELSDTVTKIGKMSFSSHSIQTFTSHSVKDVTGVFNNCTLLNTLNLDALEELDTTLFDGDKRLAAININNSEVLTSVDGVVYSKDMTELIYCPRGKEGSVEIPEGVTTIKKDAFYKCTYVSSISLPSTLLTIEDQAFYSCTALSSLVIPDSVTSIGVEILSKTKLQNLNIPFIGSSPNDKRGNIYLFGKDGYAKKITLGNACKDLAYDSLESSSLEEIYIPNSLKDLPKGLFTKCTSLKKISLPFVGGGFRGTEFMSYLFGANSGTIYSGIPKTLKEIEIRGGYELDDYAFYGFSSVTKITLPDTIEEIGVNSFCGCNSLIELTVPFIGSTVNDNQYFAYLFGDSVGSRPDTYRDNNYVLPDSLTTLKIRDGMTSIPTNCFYGLKKNLSTIELPNTITEIEDKAFYDADSLTSIVIPDSVTTLGKSVFESCSGLEVVVIGDGVTRLKSGLLTGCSSLKTLTIGRSVTAVESGCFGDRLYFNTLYWNATNCASFEKGKQSYWPLYQASSITTIVIGDNVTNIPKYFAWGCTGLTSLTIGSSVSTINEYAFYNCLSLASITYTGYSTNWSIIGKGDYWKHNVPATYVQCKDTKVNF